jgi:hypothetical protein
MDPIRNPKLAGMLILASDVPGVLDRYDLAQADARFQRDFGQHNDTTCSCIKYRCLQS